MSDNLRYLREEYRSAKRSGGGNGRSGGDEPPGGNALEKRVETIEKAIPDLRERLVKVETRLDSIEKNMATKSDIEALKNALLADFHKTLNEQTWKFIGVAISFSGLFAAIAFGLARLLK